MSGTEFDDEFKQLFTMMVQLDEHARPSIQDIMQHPFMANTDSLADGNSDMVDAMRERAQGMRQQVKSNALSVQDNTRGIGNAKADEFDSTDLLASLEKESR